MNAQEIALTLADQLDALDETGPSDGFEVMTLPLDLDAPQPDPAAIRAGGRVLGISREGRDVFRIDEGFTSRPYSRAMRAWRSS